MGRTVAGGGATVLSPAPSAAQTGAPGDESEATLSQLEGDDFVECYRTHYPRLVRAIELAGASRPVAEDVAQEAFARMLAHWRRVRRGSSPAGYAYRTAFRLLHRGGRLTSAVAVDPVAGMDRTGGGGQWQDPGPGPEGLVTSRVAVAAALAAMPSRRRSCAVLHLVVGLPTSEVAAALGIAAGTVRRHIEEARVDLRAGLAAGSED